MPAPNNKNNPLGLILILLFFVLPLISSVLENIPGFKGASSLISFIIFILIILAIGKSNGKYSELKGESFLLSVVIPGRVIRALLGLFLSFRR